jgi:hypothetical protein
MSLDLETEFMIATDAVTRRHREKFAARGLDASAIARAGGIGVARILRRSDGFYDPAERDQGETALIWPIWTGAISPVGYCEGELIDLLAWHPDKPQTFHRRSGDGVALGLYAIETAFAEIKPRPLPIYRSPLDWARAGAGCVDNETAGAVVLDWTVDNGLFGVDAVIAEDLEHGEDIEHRLKLLRWKLVPKLPDVRIRVATKIEKQKTG